MILIAQHGLEYSYRVYFVRLVFKQGGRLD
jgi:hypothetical protein